MEDNTIKDLVSDMLSNIVLGDKPEEEQVTSTGLMSSLPGIRTPTQVQQQDEQEAAPKARDKVKEFILRLSDEAEDTNSLRYSEKAAPEITDVMVDSETLLNRYATPLYVYARNLRDYNPERSTIKVRNRGDHSERFLDQMYELARQSSEEAALARMEMGITESLPRSAPSMGFDVQGLIDAVNRENALRAGTKPLPSIPEVKTEELDDEEVAILSPTDTITDDADGGAAPSGGKGLMSPRLDSKGETPEKPAAVSSKTVTDLEGPEATQTSNDVLVAQLKLASLGYDIGRGGKNKLRNLKIVSKAETKPSEVRGADGIMGKNTEAAIKKFQKNNSLEVTGTLDENTINALDEAKEPEFNFDPAYFSTEKQNKNMKALYDAAVENGITGLELVSLMSQAAHESDAFKTAEEYASGKKYEGRKDLGNTQKGDGERYKGRGFLQVTGRTNYELIGNALGINLVANPDLLENIDTAAKASIMWWKMNVRPIVSDFSDVERVTKIVNGGFNGLTDRQKYYEDFLGLT
jgi:putative chitinase